MIAGTTLVPVGSAYAHERPRAHVHSAHGPVYHNRKHRKLHRHQRAHRKAHRHYHRRNNDGDLIAAGIIGLAIGAIIGSEASRYDEPAYSPRYNAPYPSGSQYYQYDRYPSQSHTPPTDYRPGTYRSPAPSSSGPEVITFNEPGSLEPWTPGWREWCEDNYRSFNASTGTCRGYDGLDHFCVPR